MNVSSTEKGFAQVQITESSTATADEFVAGFTTILDGLNATFDSGKTRDLAWRRQQLKQLQLAVKENHAAISEAVLRDHHGPKIRSFFEMDMVALLITHFTNSCC
jgi:hypothetical protein